ncbi:MAG: ABC transporter ATP-binding protein [Niveispirillum sp.]|uniref:ABC transporter ATP-binding protein n=1 Tax=Niveispirillum sp. TaxID=1917217 RepID=UPI003BA54CD0
MLKLVDLVKAYRTEEVETTALNSVNIHVRDGEFVAIMGPSGCGKSSLLNIIGMLDTPSSGQYWFNGEDVSTYGERKLADIRKKNIGFIFQSFNLIDELTVFENVELALLYHDIPARERKERVKAALAKVNIGHRESHLPQQLSGGQQQRVAIARAVVAKPKMLLADEPTGNLDSANGDEVMRMLTDLNAEGTTIVMVTHSMPHAQYATRIINLFDGQVVAENLRAA